MKVAGRFRVFAVCILLLTAVLPPLAEAAIEEPPLPRSPLSRLSTAWELFQIGWYFYSEMPGLYSGYDKCLARGFSQDVCQSALTYCAINSAPHGTVAGAFWDLYQLDELFKANCGDPSEPCFACCFVPGSSYGCHTAFRSDWHPVINCNLLYGGGTHEVGDALVVGDPQPGQLCLFTPQTCDHLPICNLAKTPGQISAMNGDPTGILKSDGAVHSRAGSTGTVMLGDWDDYLSGYHTSADQPSNYLRLRLHPFSELAGFVTGRGCAGWRHQLPESFPTDWSEDDFRILDAQGHYADEASHYNGLRQLGVVRLMASVPNLYDRLASVESRIWTPAAIDQYLAPIGDPDTALLHSMSPLALELLKRHPRFQDYRLLAVPLPGETVPDRLYDGCTLADPPTLQLSYQKRGSLGVDLQVTAADSAASSALAVGVMILWGDGGVTQITAPPGGATQTVAHDYANGGKYQVMAMAENEAGLRTVGGLVVQTTGTGTNPANAPVPVISEIQLVDLKGEIDSFAGNTLSMMFELEGWPTPGQGYALGISRSLPVPLNTAVRFGTIGGWNMSALPLQSVTIRPSRFGAGYLVGFQKNYFTLDRIRVGFYSTQDNWLRYQDVPVTASMVRLYAMGSDTPVLLTQPTYGPDGRLQIPVEVGGVRYARVDLILPSSVFSQAVEGPVTDPSWTGLSETLSETRPDAVALSVPPLPLDFYTVPPCRLVDTRGTAGPLGGFALHVGPDRSLPLTGVCGIPADAKALSLNVTVTDGDAAGNLRFYPGQAELPVATVINFAAGATRSNNAILALAADGSGTLEVHLDTAGTTTSLGSVHLILDVNGYFK